jgi:two-component system CheB/CheR fusion protein
MNVHQIGTIEEYLRYLQINPQEVDALFRELLIGVTSFFRDPAAFDSLAGSGLPKLLDPRPDGSDVRVWVRLLTGEEAYSIAILLHGTWVRRSARSGPDLRHRSRPRAIETAGPESTRAASSAI